MTSSPGWEQLRDLLDGGELHHAPGVLDPLTARLAEDAGVRVAYLSGAVLSMLRRGLPDVGHLTAHDVTTAARPIVAGIGIPLVADADTGFGGTPQVRATVAAYRDAGIAGLHLEDQVMPKRCGHLAGKAVVDRDEAVRRVRAAVAASDGTVVIIARTDAASVLGCDEAVGRAERFLDVGADLVFLEGLDPTGVSLPARIRAGGLVVNRSEAGGDVATGPDDDALRRVGTRLVIHPVSAMLAATHAVREVFAAIVADGHAGDIARTPWSYVTRRMGLNEALARDAENVE